MRNLLLAVFIGVFALWHPAESDAQLVLHDDFSSAPIARPRLAVEPAAGTVIQAGNLAVPAAARDAEEEWAEEAASTTFCMGDNHNRIYKLSWIAHALLIGKLWATPVNGFVFGTLIQGQTGQSTIKMSFMDPVVGPPSWTCQGTGGPTLGYYNGTCKSGGLIVGWSTYSISTCPF